MLAIGISFLLGAIVGAILCFCAVAIFLGDAFRF
jgi:hypothetical protein